MADHLRGTPQQHAQVAACNFMAMTGPQREFIARDHCGNHTRWNEIAIAPTLDSTLRWRHLDRHRTYIQLDSFDGSLDLATGFDTLLTEAHAHHSQLLILDLRGNTGGALTSATALRDRFLHAHTQLGSIAFTTGTGPAGRPSPTHRRSLPLPQHQHRAHLRPQPPLHRTQRSTRGWTRHDLRSIAFRHHLQKLNVLRNVAGQK
ncbi:MAG: S41 family peptidase [Pseudonocardiaceae bacterium]